MKPSEPAHTRIRRGTPPNGPGISSALFRYGAPPLVAIFMMVGSPSRAGAVEVDCLDTEAALEFWRPLRQQRQALEIQANELAMQLLPCLGSPNAELRDQTGYELFTDWLRNEKLTVATRRALLNQLSATLSVAPAPTPDNSTLARSFSALILAEIMRSDAIQPFMTATERQELLDHAIQSLAGENDFRGLDPELGWIHPVAHLADLLWRFALHPQTSQAQAEAVLAGVRSKVAPSGIFYRFNESDRLARVVTTIVLRESVDPATIGAWIRSFEEPQSMETWSEAFASRQGMAELHNTKLFLRALSDQLEDVDVDPAIAVPLLEFVRGFTQLI